MARRVDWEAVGVLLVAAALRLLALGQVPPGLYHDEAYYGLDALDVLQGHLSLYFPANNGREPLFVYLIAVTVGLLGRSPFALRLGSCLAGLLTVAATMAAGRTLFSRRVGLLAAAVLAVTLWHVHLSRVGFRAVTLPLLIALTLWQGALACQCSLRGSAGEKRPARRWIAAGALYGLSFYTYTAARFTPVALLAFALYTLATGRRRRPSPWRLPQERLIGLGILAALVTVLPLVAYTFLHPDIVLGRPGQVSVFSPAINRGDLWRTLDAHTLRTLGMFFVRGDRIWRHNVPWRPVFDPLLGAAFLLGTAVALRRARQEAGTGLVLIWTAVMALPTLLAEDAPHFLRSVGMLPVLMFLPALGLDWLWQVGTGARLPLRLIVALVLLVGLGSTVWAYFGNYARSAVARYWFEQGAVGLAGRINRFLGTGWDGERMIHLGSDQIVSTCWPICPTVPDGGRQVYLDPALWDEWQPQIRFLVPMLNAVTIGLTGPIPPTSAQAAEQEVAVFVWPYGEWEQAWALLPAPAEIAVEEGPLSQGDRDAQPFVTYLAFFAVRPHPSLPALARFSGGIEWLGVTVSPAEGGAGDLLVRLRWRATEPLPEDYTVFLHYLRDGERIAQGDAPPAGGHYPTALWRPGDVINDDHRVAGIGTPIPGRDALLFGFWRPETGESLPVLDQAGNPVGDWMVVPVATSL